MRSSTVTRGSSRIFGCSCPWPTSSATTVAAPCWSRQSVKPPVDAPTSRHAAPADVDAERVERVLELLAAARDVARRLRRRPARRPRRAARRPSRDLRPAPRGRAPAPERDSRRARVRRAGGQGASSCGKGRGTASLAQDGRFRSDRQRVRVARSETISASTVVSAGTASRQPCACKAASCAIARDSSAPWTRK